MDRMYVPILKCKKGEQSALFNLTDDIKDKIIPLIEIPYSSVTTKKPIIELIESFWSERTFFFYFMPEWYDNSLEELQELIVNEIIPVVQNNKYAIPVFDLSVFSSISEVDIISQNGIAIRLRDNEFGQIEDMLNPLFNDNILDRRSTDLILDLQYVAEKDLFSKTAVLKSAFSDLDVAAEFRSIIISSVSFPKTVSDLEVGQIYRFKRMEVDIFTLALKLEKRFGFKYYYSDYGPTDNEDVAFVIGMSPNFKIKYTTFGDFLCIKGLSLKRGGLDIGNVQQLAEILVNSSDFSGATYSWGDEKIYLLANKQYNSPGNLTTWVSYAMNHHITFITHQI